MNRFQAWDLLASLIGAEKGKDDTHVVLGTTLQADLSHLIADIKRQRESLPMDERNEFDLCWGLTSAGDFRTKPNQTSSNHSFLFGLSAVQSTWKRLSTFNSDALSMIKADLFLVRETISNEMVV